MPDLGKGNTRVFLSSTTNTHIYTDDIACDLASEKVIEQRGKNWRFNWNAFTVGNRFCLYREMKFDLCFQFVTCFISWWFNCCGISTGIFRGNDKLRRHWQLVYLCSVYRKRCASGPKKYRIIVVENSRSKSGKNWGLWAISFYKWHNFAIIMTEILRDDIHMKQKFIDRYIRIWNNAAKSAYIPQRHNLMNYPDSQSQPRKPSITVNVTPTPFFSLSLITCNANILQK